MRTITTVFAMSACMMMAGAPLAFATSTSDELAEMREMVEQLRGQVEAQSEQIEHQGEVIKEARLEQSREDDSRFGSSAITSFLQRLEVEGWIAGSYFWNYNNPYKRDNLIGSNTGATGGVYPYHGSHNSFQVDQVWFGIEHPIDEENRAGFRFDLLYGTTAATLGNAPTRSNRCYGSGNPFGANGDCTSQYYINQAYIQYLMPFTENGITVKAGKFATLAGAEVAQTTANFNITRSNQFNLLQPIDHVGVLFDTEWGDTGITTAIGVINQYFSGYGSDYNVKKSPGVIGQLGWSSETVGVAVTGVWSDAPTAAFGGPDISTGLLDLVVTWDPTEKISTWLNFDYAWAKPGGPTAYALSVAVAGRYAVTERLGLSTRFEWVGDENRYVGWVNPNGGTADGNIYALTGTADYAITNNLMIRGEVRWDTIRKSNSNDDEFLGRGNGFGAIAEKRNQVTTGVELVYEF